MKRILQTLIFPLLLLACTNKETEDLILDEGIYFGTFERYLTWGESQTSEVIITFDDGEWTGLSEIPKYPALGNGTYFIEGDSITFFNANVWTADFDWSLIFKGKYALQIINDKIEITRDYRSSTNDSFVDRYILTPNAGI